MSDLEKKQTGLQKVSSFLNSESVKSKFSEILGSKAQGFISSVLAVCSQNDLLKNATTESIYSASLMAATLDLPINSNLGFAYIVPYRDNKSGIVSAQFQMGYKGFKQLAIRSGQFSNLHAKVVYEGQKVDDDSFLGYHFEWSKKSSDKVIGYASNFVLKSGFESTYFMGIDELNKHAKQYSQTFKKGFGLWATDFDKMCLKTVSKLHLNSGEAPLSIDMQRAVISDQSVLDSELKPTYVDNTEVIDKEEERIVLMLNDCNTIEEVEILQHNNPDLPIDLINARKEFLSERK